MTDNIKAFLEADALRTQGGWEADGCFISGKNFTIYEEGGHTEADANFIAAASRIAPDIRAMQDAFEQVCEAAESAITRLEEFDSVMVRHNLLYASPATRKRLSDSLTAAAPFRKKRV